MKIFWTATAERHLDIIYDYIAQDSKIYALRTIDNITRKTQQIGQFPMSGRKVLLNYSLNQTKIDLMKNSL